MALPATITRAIGQSKFVLTKFSPEILTTAGIIGTVASGVLASRATLKLEALVDVHTLAIESTKAALEDQQIDQKEYQKEMTANYVVFVKGLLKLYGPSVTLGLVSIASIVTANGILKKRNLALAATLKAVESSYAEYRQRIIDAIGAEKEEEIRYGVVKEAVEDENGKTKNVKKATKDPRGTDIYAFLFDSTSYQWEEGPGYNLNFLLTQQAYWNDKLYANKYVFLNEILDTIGIPRVPWGQDHGWAYDKDGANFIDFGIVQERKFELSRGEETYLKFNCQGNIKYKLGGQQ